MNMQNFRKSYWTVSEIMTDTDDDDDEDDEDEDEDDEDDGRKVTAIG